MHFILSLVSAISGQGSQILTSRFDMRALCRLYFIKTSFLSPFPLCVLPFFLAQNRAHPDTFFCSIASPIFFSDLTDPFLECLFRFILSSLIIEMPQLQPYCLILGFRPQPLLAGVASSALPTNPMAQQWQSVPQVFTECFLCAWHCCGLRGCETGNGLALSSLYSRSISRVN